MSKWDLKYKIEKKSERGAGGGGGAGTETEADVFSHLRMNML